MDLSYPFHPLQFLLDQKASLALAACLSRMGSAVQLISRGAQSQGFLLEISSGDQPSEQWLHEWFRQATLLMKEEWSLPVEMTAENVRLFWKQKGQHLRARAMSFGGSLVQALTWPGCLELFDGDEAMLESMEFDALVLLEVKPVTKQIKGHQEKIWLIQGRVAPTSEARKVLQKLKPKFNTVLDPSSLVLNVAQMQKLLKTQMLWLGALEKEASVSVLLREEKDFALKKGFFWKKENTSLRGYIPLWQEPTFETLVFKQTGSVEEVQKSLSFLLRMISEIAKILELEMKGSLRVSVHPEIMHSWVELFEANSPFPLSLIEEEILGSKGQLFWQISTLEDRVTWWSMAQIQLTCLSAGKWQLEAKPVTSFYRWAFAKSSLNLS